MIAAAAYERYARKGFANNDPLDDWLNAEAEIESALRSDCRRTPLSNRTTGHRRQGMLDALSHWLYRLTSPKEPGTQGRQRQVSKAANSAGLDRR
jgi:hypothetical protein